MASSAPSGMLTRQEMADELGIPAARLFHTAHVPRLGNRRQRRKMGRLMRRKAKAKRPSHG